MSDQPTWQFPPTNYGIEYIQDSSSAHFNNDPVPKLVREILQNSLDARDNDLTEPVSVNFRESFIDSELIGSAELKKHLMACLNQAKSDNRADLEQSYARALDALKRESIRCLQIVDAGTKGLVGPAWDALVCKEGSVQKLGYASAGGSFGTGKNAVFNLSDLRTVFYSTRLWNAREGRIEKFQGKATLMAHPDPDGDEMLQHIGFYALPKRQPLLTTQIPTFYRLDEVGTGVFIMGFNPRSSEWMDEVSIAVIQNFFYAIHHKKLVVSVASEGSDVVQVNHETLEQLFEAKSLGSDSYHYYKAIRDKEAKQTSEIEKIGPLDVYLSLGSGPRKTVYVNRNGMLITDSRDQKLNPVAPRGRNYWPHYAAVVVPATDKGDVWVRRMENPSHDSLSYLQLQEVKDRYEAKSALDKSRFAIRDIIDRETQFEQSGDTSNLDELAQWFPELDPKVPGNRVLKTLAIPTRGPQINQISNAPGPGLGPAPGPEPGPGPGPNPGPGPGPGPGPNPNPRPGPNPGPGLRPSSSPPVRNSRLILTGQSEARIAFTPSEDVSGEVVISLIPAGGEEIHQRRIDITEVEVVSPGGLEANVNNGAVFLTPETEERIVLKINTGEPIGELAFRIG